MMMCGDIMPTISEDGDHDHEGSMEDNNFEQLMVNMLDERDKLMETLRETQENLTYTRSKLKDTEMEKDALLQKFEILLNEVGTSYCIINVSYYGFEDVIHTILSYIELNVFPIYYFN